MKEFFTYDCCADHTLQYLKPWCCFAHRSDDDSCCILHLWYKIDCLQEEIARRSAYLGKFRRTDEAAHLLDLIKMTKDEEKLFIPFAKAAMADIFDVLHLYMPEHDKAYFWREGKETAVFTDDPLPDPAVTFYAGQYVQYNGDLYMAIEDGSSADFAGKLVPTEDYRDSIHYGIKWHCDSNVNVVEPLDTSIFEALVARIIYKWLKYAYPGEAQSYLDEYNEHLASIQTRARMIDGAQIEYRRTSL